jgi:integrase
MKTKPKKPFEGFPLTAHNNGQWCKSIGGKLKYFGAWDDPKGALRSYKKFLADPYAQDTSKPSVADLVNTFLADKKRRVAAGSLSQRTWDDYYKASARIITAFGRNRPLESLGPEDFEDLRTSFPATWNTTTINNEICRISAIINYASGKHANLCRPIPTGEAFHRLPARQAAKHRNPRLFSPAELARILQEARGPLKAFTLLGINAGLGNADCGLLEARHVDLETGWLDYPRPKTGVPRQAFLWPETIAEMQGHRSETRFWFATRFGNPWADTSKARSPIASAFAKLLARLEIRRKGVGFYSLRHTFRTLADGCGDPIATMRVMGHHDPSMSGVYREWIDPERIRHVCNFVRKKLPDILKD